MTRGLATLHHIYVFIVCQSCVSHISTIHIILAPCHLPPAPQQLWLVFARRNLPAGAPNAAAVAPISAMSARNFKGKIGETYREKKKSE